MLYVTHIQNQEVSETLTYLLIHTYGSSISDKVKYFDCPIKIEVPTPHKSSEFIKAFALPLETTSLDGVW